MLVQRHKESFAIENLKKLDVDSCWPRFYQDQVVNNKVVRKYETVFPGYMFVKFNRQEDEWKRINSVKGIRGILMCGDYVPSLPECFVNEMINKYTNGLIKLERKSNDPKYGDKLKIVNGPLSGRIGICEHSSHGRVILLLTLLGQESKLMINCKDVVPASGLG